MKNTVRICFSGCLASLLTAAYSYHAPLWVLATLVVVTVVCLTWQPPAKEKPRQAAAPMIFYPLDHPELSVSVASKSDVRRANVVPGVTLFMVETPDKFELLEGYGRHVLPKPLTRVRREETRHLMWCAGLLLFAVFCIVLDLTLRRADVRPSLGMVALLSVMGSVRSSWYIEHLFWRDPIYRQRNTTFNTLTKKLQREGKQPSQLLERLPD